MVNAPTDEQLLADHLAGDGASFESLVRRYQKELYQFVLRFTNSSAAAEDVVQDAFLQVHLVGATFDTSRRFKPWLFTIAANKARDWLRRRTRRQEVPLDAKVGGEDGGNQSFADLLADDQQSAGADLDQDVSRQVVQRVVREMPDNLREVLVLGYFHGFAYKEMASVLDVPLGTVKSRLHAAVASFARRYKATAQNAPAHEDMFDGGL